MEPWEIERFEHTRREFRAAIQPWVDLKLAIVHIALPTIIIGPNFYSRTYPPDVQELLDWCDASIEDVARRRGLIR